MLVARPPAKVNLSLEVLDRRPDGLHELRSVFVRVGLSDRLTVEPGPGPGDRLTVTGLAGVPTRGNLVLRAFEALRAHAGLELPPLDATLDKHIPVAAGLGGGSSDAAAALALAQAAWGIALAPAVEMMLAAELGSDVPFFMANVAAARVEGRGERVGAIEAPAAALLLVTPPIALSTAAVFARFDELREATPSGVNGLWPAAVSLEPSLAQLVAWLNMQTGVDWQMSGSGPTLFAVYPLPEAAVAAGQALVRGQPAELTGARINAVDLVGPDPAWRYP